MNKFEQLIEYVINDEEQKARELFHDIVVEKSRNIYEELMAEEEIEEGKDEELDEASCDDEMEESIEESQDEDLEEGLEEMGGDQSDDLIDDIETEEQGLSMEGEEGGEDLEDRVVDLEDKLDELMAEFEALMGDDAGAEDAEMDAEVDAGLDDMGDGEEVDMDAEFDSEEEMAEGLEEGISLKAAPKPVTSEEGNINKKGVVASNSGAKGAVAKPVSTDTTAETGRSAPTAKDLGGTTSPKQGPAPKAQTAQATGVNTKSPY